MKKLIRIVSIMLSALLLGGCAEMFVPYDGRSVSDDSRDGALLKEEFGRSDGEYLVLVLNGGEFSVESGEEFSDELAASMLADMLSEEGYAAYGGAFSARSEYVSSVLDGSEYAVRFDKNGDLIEPQPPLVHIRVKLLDDEETFLRAANEIRALIEYAELPETDKPRFANARYSPNENGTVSVTVEFAGNDSALEPLTSEAPVSGGEVMVCGVLVPANTKRLVLASRDRSMVDILAHDFIPEGCEYICGSDCNFENTVYDLSEIAKKLPGLKELYMYQARVKDTAAIAELKNLEALSYYAIVDPDRSSAAADLPFTELPKLRSLRIYGDYDDYSFLGELTGLEELHVDVCADGEIPRSLFDCPAVTSLCIPFSAKNIDGIDKLRNLKSLEISTFDNDLAQIGRLANLEYLNIRCPENVKNLYALGNLDRLTTLVVMELENSDWTFLSDMDSLSALTLSYIENIDGGDLAALKRLTSLSLSHTTVDYNVLGEMTALESFADCMRGGDYSALSRCSNLKQLELLGCSGALDCEYVRGLPLETLVCDGTDAENIAALCGIPPLKLIDIAMEAAEFDCEDELRAALPDCEIRLRGDPFFHASER